MNRVLETSDAANHTNANNPIVSSRGKDSHTDMSNEYTHGSSAIRENITNDEAS